MARTRTARVLAAVAGLPLAVVLLGGVAHADPGPSGPDVSWNASVPSVVGSGVAGLNAGNSSTTQQVATGPGAKNQNNTANANGPGLTVIDQDTTDIVFSPLW